MNIDLRKLEIYCRVADLGSFSEAAASLHMAQPAVSIAVRKLEEALGLTLLDRSGRAIALTQEGLRLQAQGRQILQQVERLKDDAADMAGLLQGELSVACPSMIATYFMPDLLGEFLGEHSGLKASVIQAGTAQAEQMILSDEVEIGVITMRPGAQYPDLDLVPLVEQAIVIAVPNDHPWAARKRLRIKDLDGAPMVIYESGYFIRELLDEICEAHRVRPDYRLQSNFLPLLLRMLRRGLGCTIALEVLTDTENDLQGIALSPPARINVALAKRRGRTVSRANQAFLDWAASR